MWLVALLILKTGGDLVCAYFGVSDDPRNS